MIDYAKLNKILNSCTERLKKNDLDEAGLFAAQEICFQYREDAEMQNSINKYTEIADRKTDGLFSECMESWKKDLSKMH